MFQKLLNKLKRTEIRNPIEINIYSSLEIYIQQNEIEIKIQNQSISLDEKNTQNKINKKDQQKYQFTIQFNKNEIEIGNTNGIDLNTTTEIQIEYQQQEYQLSKEELIALYFLQFKRIIEKKWILTETKITIDQLSQIDINSLIKGLYLSDCKNISINNEFQQSQDLSDEAFEQIDDIMNKQDDYLLFKKRIERMKTLISKRKMKSLYHLLQIDINTDYSSTKLHEITTQLTCQQRTQLGLYQLDNNYCLYLSSRYFSSITDFINLEMSIKRMNGNLSKFFYNPIEITETIRPFFPNLRTLYIYHNKDCRFEDDPNIHQRIEWKVSEYNLFIEYLTAIEQLTRLTCSQILFDTDIHDWSEKSTILTTNAIGKSKVVFLVETDDGELFGYYRHGKIPESKYLDYVKDYRSFHFNIESNGRLQYPMKFDLMNKDSDCVSVENVCGKLASFGTILFCPKEIKDCSYWNQVDDDFYYHGIKSAMYKEKYFHPKRLLVIQMI